MPAPEPPANPNPPPDWTQEDADAMLASAAWLDWRARPELLKQYEGMHVAIFGEQIIDADRDKQALFQRLDADGGAPPTRTLIRYIPTPEEAWSGLS